MAKVSSKSSKPAKVVKKQESESDSDSSSSSSSSSSSESDSDSSDSEEEEKPLKTEKKDDSSSDSDSDSDSDSSSDEEEEKKEEEKKKADESSDSDSSSSDSSDDEDDKEEEKSEAKKDDSDSDSDSSSSSDSSSDSDSSDDEEEKEDESSKRKADDETEEPSAKKQKVEESTEEPATLFVGRLSWSVDDEWLKREFEPCGGVISARVMMERATNKSRGYGYVDFISKAAAEKALNEMQGKEIDGRPINLDMSSSKPKPSNDRAKKFGDVPSAPSDTLFVGNLSFNAERSLLYDIFGAYGTVVSCRVPTHPDTQQPKGFGYVQFSSVDEAKSALEALNGEYIEGRACRLDYSTPRDNNSPRPSGGRGGARGGFGGRGGARGGFGGRERSATPTPRTGANSAEFKGTKKTFD